MLQVIARIVRAARERTTLSLDDVSRESGVAMDAIASLERGQPGMATTDLFDVARVLSLDPVALLGGHEMRSPSRANRLETRAGDPALAHFFGGS